MGRTNSILLTFLLILTLHAQANPTIEDSLQIRENLLASLPTTSYALLKTNTPPCLPPDLSKLWYPFTWKKNIMTTIFWIGEKPCRKNPVPNDKSSWDSKWVINYGGYDSPNNRLGFIPKGFTPQLNPFYAALPYNDIETKGTKTEAKHIIPWFSQRFKKNGQSVIKGQWMAIHYKGRVCYAQWEDCGPFETDNWQYVFGGARPRQKAGLDISPAVRDYLGMKTNDFTDWKFVNLQEIPWGPWTKYGENNIFSPQYQKMKKETALTSNQNDKMTKQNL